jgi:creatinine amidohydrolase
MFHRLHDLTWEDAQRVARPGTVVLIPTGSTEQHGRHLPVEVDSRLVSSVAARAAELAGEQVDVVLAPVLPYGASHHHLEFGATMSLALPTYINVLAELADSLIGYGGFSHVLFLNGHGGNTDPIHIAVRMTRDKYPEAVVAGADYWSIAGEAINRLRKSPPGGVAHACEFEAAMMMHLRPESVRRDKIIKHIPEWTTEHVVMDLTRGGGVAWGHHMVDVTATGVIGDPTLATPEHGKAFFEAVTERVGAFLVDFSRWTQRGLVRNR